MICQSETESTSQIIFITLFSQSWNGSKVVPFVTSLGKLYRNAEPKSQLLLTQASMFWLLLIQFFLMGRVISTEHCWGMFLWVPPIIVCSLKLLFLSFFCNFIHMYGICLSGPCHYVLIETLLKNDWSRWFAISGLPPIWCSQSVRSNGSLPVAYSWWWWVKKTLCFVWMLWCYNSALSYHVWVWLLLD